MKKMKSPKSKILAICPVCKGLVVGIQVEELAVISSSLVLDGTKLVPHNSEVKVEDRAYWYIHPLGEECESRIPPEPSYLEIPHTIEEWESLSEKDLRELAQNFANWGFGVRTIIETWKEDLKLLKKEQNRKRRRAKNKKQGV